MDNQHKLSRRSMLTRAAWLAGATLAGTVIPIELASAQQKASKDAMKYQDKPKGDQRCDNCMQFVAPSSCKVVDGTISPSGWCMAWVKKA
jgi:high potential iron-sulfur protein